MRLSRERIQAICAEQGISVSELLAKSRVSRTALYSLFKRPSIVPASVAAIAAELGVSELDLIEPDSPEATRVKARLRLARKICRAEPEAVFQNVWHTLSLREMDPLSRLEGSLRRGRTWTA